MKLLLALSLACAQPETTPDPVAALSAGEVNVDHYFNLGLELEAHEQRAHAVLAYRRGLLLAPHDAQVQERLALMRALPEDTALLGPQISGWLGVLSWAAAFLLLAAWRLQRQRAWAALALPVALLGAALMAMTQQTLSAWGSQGLVLESAVVASQAGEGGQPLFELSALETVEILVVGEEALQIRTKDGRVGWMSEQHLGVLDPRAEARGLR